MSRDFLPHSTNRVPPALSVTFHLSVIFSHLASPVPLTPSRDFLSAIFVTTPYFSNHNTRFALTCATDGGVNTRTATLYIFYFSF
jgi:hypothetical protein